MTDQEIRNAALAFLIGMIELVFEEDCKDALYERYNAVDAMRVSSAVTRMAAGLIVYAANRWASKAVPPTL